MKYIKIIIKASVLLSILLFVKSFCEKKTSGFTIAAISSDRPFDKEWEVHSLSPLEEEDLQKALNQKYTYCCSGGQSFVFLSEDRAYAFKFFKQRFFNLPQWLNWVPISFFSNYRDKKIHIRREKLKRDFASYKMAFDELQEESGLVYVHLNKTEGLNKKLIIKDPLNIEHRLDLDAFDFVVQKKAELAYDRINRAMLQGDIKGAKKNINTILELILKYSQKGYLDRDPNIATNCGLLGNKAILVDVGKLIRDEQIKEPENYNRVLCEICQPFDVWLQRAHPVLAVYLEEELVKHIDE
jgi:hypothetical protein